MSELTKKTRSRKGHRAYVTKQLAKVKEIVSNFKPEDRTVLTQLKLTLTEKIETISKLDEQILDLIEKDDLIEKEIEESSEIKSEIYGGIAAIYCILSQQQSKTSTSPEASDQGSKNTTSLSTISPTARVKLPKLEVPKFNGRVQDWTEFWDSFESAIHKNGTLNDVDKFTYLRGLLEEPAKSTIAGFSLTGANYETALELLKRRFGRQDVIQRAHINEMMNVRPVFNEGDTKRLRSLFDTIETNYRALEALKVDVNTYSSIVVPAIVSKLPEAIRLTITRGADYLKWSTKDLAEALLVEVELRESHATTEEQPKPKGRWQKHPTTTSAFLTKKGDDGSCAFCLGKHKHEDCRRVTDPSERRTILRKYSRCFRCICKGHLARNCTSRITCSECDREHHKSICGKLKEVSEKESVETNASPRSSFHVGTGNRVALQTAQGMMKGENRKRVRVLFDSGSQKSFVTVKSAAETAVKELRKEWLEISTFGQSSKQSGLRSVVSVEIEPVRGGNGVTFEAYAVPEISLIRNENLEIVKGEYAHLKDLWLSDVCKGKEMLEIDVLIGADNLWAFQSGRTVRGGIDEPVAVETSLGWVLSGPMKGGKVDGNVRVNFVMKEKVNDGELDADVRKLWDLETLGIMEGDRVHEALVDKITFNESTGRYSVGLPWKQGHDVLPTNHANSLARMKGQIVRLKKEPNLLKEYDAIIKDQLESGVIEKVCELESAGRVHYLPHQAVIRKEAKTTKLRIVYDASSKVGKKGTSLNQCLHVGPSLTPLLFEILLRFRENRVVLIGDVEKAFLNIEVDQKDRDCLRFLWVKGALNDNLETVVYRFCRVVFGLNASPFLLNATLRHHIERYAAEDAGFVRKMLEGFYVDDLVSGGRTTDEVVSLFEKSKSRMAAGGFRLRKWLTNDETLRGKFTDCDGVKSKAAEVTRLDEVETYAKSSLGLQKDLQSGVSCEKVLGLNWDCVGDTITFDLLRLSERSEKLSPTKRNLLSILAGVFDPLGIIGPVVVPMKVLFQELCASKVGWDEELSKEHGKRLLEWVNDMKEVKEIGLQRCVYEDNDERVISCSLHGFGDASEKAYCAVVYFVCQTERGIYVRLLTAKSRVAPLKSLTIPRLELMSAVILARLMDSVRNALQSQVEGLETKYWLDSKTALCWIRNQGEWKQFVRHRVNGILKLTNKRDWGHCPGPDNPADLGSRGVLPSKLKCSELWWSGPKWLVEKEEMWPRIELVETLESKEEAKKAVLMAVSVKEVLSVSNIVEIDRYSSLEKVVRVTAWVNRFICNLKTGKSGEEQRLGSLARTELLEAERVWIVAEQTELRAQDNFNQLNRQLQLFEENGVLRCKGRLTEADLDEETKYPVLLPREGRLTKLIIEKCHIRVHHSGVRSTLAELRSRYWVPKGRQVVKKVIGRCVVCKKLEGKAYSAPETANLPEFRVKEVAAFSKTGVDFAGPLYVKNRSGEMDKVYVALFSCCTSRAIHLDLVADMSAPQFLRCLRRFSARRGTPTLIISDNAKTFKATEKALRRLYNSNEVCEYLEGSRIDWRFNLERAPWWGGFFERMVKCVKRCLKKVLRNARLSFNELLTTLVEIEGTLNSRPLTYEYNEVGYEVLTPSHLIYGRRLMSMPDEDENEAIEEDTDCNKRFRYLTKKKRHFWNRWLREYLVDLREFHCGRKGGKLNSEVGDIVVVHEDNSKRGNWKMAVVDELIKGKDGETRGARVRVVKKGKVQGLSRPVQKLYPLEVRRESRVIEIEQKEKETRRNIGNERKKRPRRAAALDAEWKTKGMID